MRAFLAVSVAPGASPRGHAPDEAIARHLSGDATTHRTADGWVAFASKPAGSPEKGFTALLTKSVRSRAADLDASRIGAALGGRLESEALAGILPPFAAAHWSGPGQPVVTATDWLGLRQVYWWQGRDIAAVSTSARALAALAEAPLDDEALQAQSLIGWQVGLDTPFRGVAKLAPGSAALLRGGEVTVERYVEPLGTFDREAPPLDLVVDEMAGILGQIGEAYLTDHPGTVIQLTGGQDSRILLCAVPPALRSRLRAMTLGTEGAADVRVAAKLSAALGIEHHVHWLDRQEPITPATAHELAVAAARDLDCAASPMALAPLMLAEQHIEQGHRLSGIGGETARGFFYPGQPGGAETTPRLVERLANWRLFPNESVAAEALDPDFAATAREHTLRRLNATFDGYSRQWLRATDEFYLFERTQRWAGAQGTPASVNRHFVNPLLDREVMRLALAAAPDDKRNSRLSGRLVQRLDRGLALVPLDSGLVPARMGRSGLRATAGTARLTARKAIGKARQRFGGVRRAQLGAAEMAGLVVAHWRAEPALTAPLRGTGIVSGQWLDGLLEGRHDAAATTVAFLVNLAVAGEITARTQATA